MIMEKKLRVDKNIFKFLFSIKSILIACNLWDQITNLFFLSLNSLDALIPKVENNVNKRT